MLSSVRAKRREKMSRRAAYAVCSALSSVHTMRAGISAHCAVPGDKGWKAPDLLRLWLPAVGKGTQTLTQVATPDTAVQRKARDFNEGRDSAPNHRLAAQLYGTP